jgi:transcriptional regulator with XRE-family HTH domain
VATAPKQHPGNRDRGGEPSRGVSQRLRAAREQKNLSLRELAHRIDVSPSALSQIETGKAQPSVKTLYALVSELRLSLDELFENRATDSGRSPEPERRGRSRPTSRLATVNGAQHSIPASPLLKFKDRPRLELASGVHWDRLTSRHDPLVDFLYVTYAPGSESNSTGALSRHAGQEYGIVVGGTIDVTIGFETYRCETGDSISFNSDEPHLLANPGSQDATAVWFVVGRRDSDPRDLSF